MAPRRFGTGYINPSQYLEANLGAGSRMAGQLAGDIEGQAGQYGQDLTGLESQFQNQLRNESPIMSLGAMPGYEDLARRAAQISLRARQAGSAGGTGALLAEQYGGMRTPGGSAYDAFYARAAPGADRLGNLASQYGELSKALGVRDTASRDTATTVTGALTKKQGATPTKLPTKTGPTPTPPIPGVPEGYVPPTAEQQQHVQEMAPGEYSANPFGYPIREAERKRVREAARAAGF